MKRLLIDCAANEIRVALLHDHLLTEIYIDPIGAPSLVGYIYVGRVQNVLPGQFAFVDIGHDKNAFMNLPRDHGVKKGDAILLQIYKDAHGTKGPYGGQALKIKGHHVITFPTPRGEIGVSHKIEDPQERSRLRKAVHATLEKGFGAIVRTEAMGQDESIIKEETTRLIALHHDITTRAAYAKPPVRLYPAKNAAISFSNTATPSDDTADENTIDIGNPDFTLPDTLPNLLIDLLSDDLAEIHVATADRSPAFLSTLTSWINQIKPSLTSKILHYNKIDNDLFASFNIPQQITRALAKTVHLPCGGHMTIEQTEACVVIDVNTGAFSGSNNYRAAILRTNLEAAAAIAFQLTLRNLSGIIIVDFIDMKDRNDKQTLLQTLASEIKKDRIKTELIGMTELGLVQLTRRKTRPPLHAVHAPTTAQTHTKNPI